jgi:hypothetical protein
MLLKGFGHGAGTISLLQFLTQVEVRLGLDSTYHVRLEVEDRKGIRIHTRAKVLCYVEFLADPSIQSTGTGS